MSLRPSRYAAKNRTSKSGSPNSEVPLPFGTVQSRARRFHLISSPGNSSEYATSGERQGVQASVGWKRPTYSQLTKYSAQSLDDIPDFRTPPATQSSVFHSCGRHEYGEQRRESRARTQPFLQPSCRKSFSMGHLCNKFGLTEIHSSDGRHASNANKGSTLRPINLTLPAPTYEAPPFVNPLAPTKEPQDIPFVPPNSHRTPRMEKWRSARDMFAQYDINMPSGWLSDVEDLSLSGDGNASPRRCCRYCHICSTPTWAPTHCSACGHHLCQRCVCEISSGTPQAHPGFSHHPSPTIIRDGSHHIITSKPNQHLDQAETTSSTSNRRHHEYPDRHHHRSSSYRDDSSWRNRNQAHAVKTTTLREKSSQPARHDLRTNEEPSQQALSRPKQLVRENPFLVRDRKGPGHEMEEGVSVCDTNQVDCDDPMCRATHAGHHPFRHSVSCPKHQGKRRSPALEPDSFPDRPPVAKVFKTIDSDTSLPPDQAHTTHRHHTADFHSSNHIVEHLSSAVGHSAYDLLNGRGAKEIQSTPSSPKRNMKPISYLEPLTPAKSVTEIDSFQWTPDPIPRGHPGGLNNGRRKPSTATEVTASVSDRWVSGPTDRKTTREAKDVISEGSVIRGEQRDIHNDLNASMGGHDYPRVRLASTPSWLRNPTKVPADATAPLHHINTKSHRTYEHEHGNLSSVTVNG
ncbi:hypothetical protein F5B22DRAFT_20279 [Xylaria bambusicola]|uniref:uncharacterized protein n=1 Tax=Xylaria bambusicola TaxID=326684 RepID=UPI0020086243|nr:uncharacterized protein F5B22DRAFT_20279 [Xylaria bambusicola]KAI0528104.1 hypothetical protein F5B22DRAFT_20279 [Xylaria bambusicola]